MEEGKGEIDEALAYALLPFDHPNILSFFVIAWRLGDLGAYLQFVFSKMTC